MTRDTKATPDKTETGVKVANQRGTARLGAVQALYQMDVTDVSAIKVMSEFENFRLGKEVDGEQYRDADAGWFRNLVGGVMKNQRAIDPLIHKTLPDDWPLVRIDSTLRAILRCATFELMCQKDIPSKVIITEYVELALAFFEGDEPKMVNGVLDRIARNFRDGELDALAAELEPEVETDENAES